MSPRLEVGGLGIERNLKKKEARSRGGKAGEGTTTLCGCNGVNERAALRPVFADF